MRCPQFCQENPEYVEEKEDVSGNADESWQVGQPFNPPGSRRLGPTLAISRMQSEQGVRKGRDERDQPAQDKKAG